MPGFSFLHQHLIARANLLGRFKQRRQTRRIFRAVRGLRLGQSDYRYNPKSRRQRRYIRSRYR